MPHKDATGKTTWTTPELLTYFAVAATAGVVVGVLAGRGTATIKADEEERPPIIVNNGSVDFEADKTHGNHDKATWVDLTGQSMVFTHTQPGGAPVLGLLVETDPAKKATCTLNGTATGLLPPFFGSKVIVGYGIDSGTVKTATLEVVGAATQLTLTEPADIDGNKWNAKIKDADSTAAHKLKIRTIEVGSYLCTLDNQGTTKLAVHQLK